VLLFAGAKSRLAAPLSPSEGGVQEYRSTGVQEFKELATFENSRKTLFLGDIKCPTAGIAAS
jgi:hypothetical protein